MKEAHSTFVQNAQEKIDRNKEQYARSFSNTAATCPYCQKDCQTRKNLMSHLGEHKDLETDEETSELKIIRITNENKKSLIDQFGGEKAAPSSSGSSTSAAATAASSSPNFVHNLIRAIESDPAKIASSKIRVSSTCVKLPERRYKCFWCDTSFRKRGKLMDHIDMFHKANKHQTELEAELLQGVSRETSMQEPDKNKPSTSRQTSSSHVGRGSGLKDFSLSRSKSSEKQMTSVQSVTIKPKKKCCTFTMVGSIREESKFVNKSVDEPLPSQCRFYFRSDGDLLVEQWRSPSYESSCSTDEGPSDLTTGTSHSPQPPPFSPTCTKTLRSASFSNSNCSQTSTQPRLTASFSHEKRIRESSFPATAPAAFASPELKHDGRNVPLTQPMFSPAPYYMPPGTPVAATAAAPHL
jgi:hypothetical protein